MTPPEDHKQRPHGIVSLFYVVAQAINWFVFGVAPSPSTAIGGVWIVGGGLVMTFGRA